MLTQSTRHHRNRFLLALALTAALILGLTGCRGGGITAGPGAAESAGQTEFSSAPLTVHFIDVGQGDSILAESDGHFLLIDAGENDQGGTVVSYLQKQGVQTLDFVIGTHPHSDHIGGLDTVLAAFPADRVILPPIEHTTKTFEDVLDAVAAQGLKLTRPTPGDTYRLGSASFTILSPVRDYGDDLNNWSVGIRLVLGDNAFVLCGDAEAAAEEDIVNSGLTLSADVLKVGHHGSRTSTSDAFLRAVSPTWAVIECGRGNSYGHPHQETLDKLNAAGITVLRTDELGTITARSDGSTIQWDSERGGAADGEAADGEAQTTAAPAADGQTQTTAADAQTYILNTNTRKFHLPSCPSAAKIQAQNRDSFTGPRGELLEEGYQPCGQCKP